MKGDAVLRWGVPLFRRGEQILYAGGDALFTIPLADLLHAYQLNANPERLRVDFRVIGSMGGLTCALRVTGTVVREADVPDSLVDVDPAMSHFASTVTVHGMAATESRSQLADAEAWEPTAEQELAGRMFCRYCDDVRSHLAEMSVKDALHSAPVKNR